MPSENIAAKITTYYSVLVEHMLSVVIFSQSYCPRMTISAASYKLLSLMSGIL